MTIINESGLYSLIFSSKLPKAKEFKHWVTSEVLPAIRKTGHYDLSGYNSRVTGVGEIVNLLKLSKDVMRNQGCNNVDIALVMKDVCGQFGIKCPNASSKNRPLKKHTITTDLYFQEKLRGDQRYEVCGTGYRDIFVK